MTISSNKDLKQFFLEHNYNLYGVGLTAFSRAISEKSLANYSIVSMRSSLDSDTISKRIKTFILQDFIGNEVNNIEPNAFSVINAKETQINLNKTSKNYLLSYSGRKDFENLCLKNNWVSAIGSSDLGINFLENKVKFREFLNEINISNHPDSFSKTIGEINYKEITEKLGQRIVIQVPKSGGGRGTFFINNEEEFNSGLKNAINFIKDEKGEDNELLISKFAQGRSASISLVATKWGTFVSPIQYQISDIYDLVPKEKGNGVFIGHDWTASQEIKSELNEKAIVIGQKIGDAIYKLGFRGFFGLDILIDEQNNDLNIIECNPRLTGVMPTLDMIQERSDSPLFFSLHFLEFISNKEHLDINLDYKKLQSEIQNKKHGAHFHFYSNIDHAINIKFEFKHGVYTLEDSELKFERDGFNMSDLNNEKEFIITELPNISTKIIKYGVMGRVLTLQNVLDIEGKFTQWGKDIAKAIYKGITILN